MTVPPPPAVPGELIEKAAARLRSIHWDGNGCGTHGTSACVLCFGPSPLDDREVAKEVLAAVYGGIVEAARRDAAHVLREYINIRGDFYEPRPLEWMITELAQALDVTLRKDWNTFPGSASAVPGIAGSDGAQIAVQPRAGEHRAEYAGARGEGICRTCLAPIWNEGGTIGRQHRSEGWSDRIERGGDSLVCFKAVHYRHVPLGGREACIYDRAFARGAASKVTR